MKQVLFGMALLLALSFSASGSAFAATFTALDYLPGGGASSYGTAVSADGSVVAGMSDSTPGNQAFRWTSAGGMVGLGDLPGGDYDSIAYGLSSTNGSVVVGGSDRSNGYQAFRWTSGGGMAALGDLAGGGVYSYASGVSADGSVVVGEGTSGAGADSQAFRWTSSGMVGLGDLAGGSFYSTGSAVSADGSVVVGSSESASGVEAFRWTSGGGMVGLGDLPGSFFDSFATGVSSDGSVVVGRGYSTAGPEAFRWTSGGGMVGLGDLAGGGFLSYASGVSGDGLRLVGGSDTGSLVTGGGIEAFLWTSGIGMERLFDVLIAGGATGLTGWTLRDASAISADGLWVVGTGINPLGFEEAYIANIGPAAVPVPPAVWLFGSALGLMGVLRRKISS